MKEPIKVLFIAQEIKPYLPDSEISVICRELPQYMQEHGCEIRTFMPCYGNINERRNQLHEVQRLSGMNLIIDDTDHPLIIKVASIQSARMQVYFIDNDDYFRRKGVVSSESGEEYEDNDERSIFFVRGVLETIKKLRWTPDIIHCHGWMTSVAPIYIKKLYHDDPFFENSKVVYSVYDNGFKNDFRAGFETRLRLDGIGSEDVAKVTDKPVSYVDLCEFAIDYSDAVIAATPEIDAQVSQYAEQSGKPFLPYTEDYKPAYMEFYEQLMEVKP